MSDLRPQYNEEAVGANHPTKPDVLNRAFNPEHNVDGTHKTTAGASAGSIPTSYLDTDETLAANSDTKIATQQAVKAYVDALADVINALQYKGATDCSGNPNYPAASKGHLYKVSVAGKIGGASGIAVEANDMFICNTDATASGNQATVGAYWDIIQGNIVGALLNVVEDTTPQLGGDLDTNSKNIVLDGTPDTDHTSTGLKTATFAAGASVTLMDLVTLNSSSKWLLTDANSAATYAGMLAISLESKTDTQAMNVALPGSFVRDDTWNWTPGAVLYMSETAGAITATQPTTTDAAIRVVGFAVTADVIWFNPSPDYITHT